MSKQHIAGFLAALAASSAIFFTLEAASATTPEHRGNPAVTDEDYTDSRLASPVAPSQLRHVVA